MLASCNVDPNSIFRFFQNGHSHLVKYTLYALNPVSVKRFRDRFSSYQNMATATNIEENFSKLETEKQVGDNASGDNTWPTAVVATEKIKSVDKPTKRKRQSKNLYCKNITCSSNLFTNCQLVRLTFKQLSILFPVFKRTIFVMRLCV